MRTRDQIFTEVLVRNNRTTTDSFITDTHLKSWFRDSHAWAASQHKWPFTESRLQTTFTTGSGPNSDEWYFENVKADSIRLMQVGGKKVRKLTFDDYLIFREEEPSNNDRVFSDYGRTVFINPNSDLTGTLVVYAQYQPYVDVTDENGLTVFSDYDEEGNEAIVEKMSCYLKRREHLTDEAELHDQRARAKLDEIWQRILDEQAMYQTHPSRGGMFDWFNIVDNRAGNQPIRRDRWE